MNNQWNWRNLGTILRGTDPTASAPPPSPPSPPPPPPPPWCLNACVSHPTSSCEGCQGFFSYLGTYVLYNSHNVCILMLCLEIKCCYIHFKRSRALMNMHFALCPHVCILIGRVHAHVHARQSIQLHNNRQYWTILFWMKCYSSYNSRIAIAFSYNRLQHWHTALWRCYALLIASHVNILVWLK